MTVPNTKTVTLPLVRAIETAWAAIQANNPEVPDVVVTLGSGQRSKNVRVHGSFTPSAWIKTDTTLVHELFLGGESLARGPVPLLGTILHEATHALAEAKGIKDTSRGGRYHNDEFRKLAEAMGIDVQKVGKIGWSETTVPQETQTQYSRTIRSLREALTAHRKTFGTDTDKRPSSNNGVTLECACETPRKIRASLKVADQGAIICGVCLSDFKVIERPTEK